MRWFLFSVLLLSLFSALIVAHEEEDAAGSSCAAPVLSELTIPLWQFAALVVVFVIGALAAGFGLSYKKMPIAAVGVVLILAASVFYLSGPGFNLKTGFFEKNQHVHADIQVYLQGSAVNLSESRFQSTNQRALTEYIHFHDGRGNVVHLHASGVPLSYLFGTFGGFLNSSCLQVAAGEPMVCNAADGSKALKFFVNGNAVSDLSSYSFHDVDRLLISFGPKDADVSGQLASVTKEACIVSGTCPVPPGYDLHQESCAS